MVDMGMGEENGVEPLRLEREGAVVQRLQGLGALEHAAVDEDAPAAGLEEVAGAGHDVGGTEDMDAQGHQPSPISPGATGVRYGAMPSVLAILSQASCGVSANFRRARSASAIMPPSASASKLTMARQ